jgi:hypothetical protein
MRGLERSVMFDLTHPCNRAASDDERRQHQAT